MTPRKTYICLCSRNCEKYIQNVFENIHDIIRFFDDYKILIAYDESNDKTLYELVKQNRKYGEKMHIIIGKPMNPSKYRTENIANARNSLLDYMRNEQKTKNIDFQYFIMMDSDDVCAGKIHLDVFSKYLQDDFINKWDALSFNRRDYYDIWALSASPYVYSCWHWKNPVEVVEIMRYFIINELKKLGENDLYYCYSAFNGFAIYKTNIFLECSYHGTINKSLEYIPYSLINTNVQALCGREMICIRMDDCEHRSFHFQATSKYNAKIVISPKYLFDELPITSLQNA